MSQKTFTVDSFCTRYCVRHWDHLSELDSRALPSCCLQTRHKTFYKASKQTQASNLCFSAISAGRNPLLLSIRCGGPKHAAADHWNYLLQSDTTNQGQD